MVNSIKSRFEVNKQTDICQTILAVKISIVCYVSKSGKSRLHGSEARLIFRTSSLCSTKYAVT